MLTQERLKEVLDYNPETGIFKWIKKTSALSRIKIGNIAGSKCEGYISINIDSKKYKAHRLAWLYVHGSWPQNMIDHVNENGINNRIENLREATNGQNNMNRGKQKNNTSGFKGVYWHHKGKKWEAKIGLKRKSISLGLFASKEDAYAAYCKAAKELHGEFANLS